MGSKFVSFDLFDTLVTRGVSDPKAVFTFAAAFKWRKSIYHEDCLRFAVQRADCERRLSRKFGLVQYRVEEIYEMIAVQNADTQHRVTPDDEKRAELALIMPLWGNVKLFDAVRSDLTCERVLIISDSYWLASDLREICLVLADRRSVIISSADQRDTKESGLLYRRVLNQFSLSAATWLHLGDNVRSDIASAKTVGLSVRELSAGRPVGLEIPRSKFGSTGWMLESLVGGVARAMRLNGGHGLQAYSCIIAPVFFQFTVWILKQAVSNQRKNVWFISRDGQAFLRIAKILCAHDPDYATLMLHYLPASREAFARLRANTPSDKRLSELKSIFGDQFGDSAVFVDLGWHGSFANILSELTDVPGIAIKPLFAYFAIDPQVLKAKRLNVVSFTGEFAPRFYRRARRNLAVIETFAAATHRKVVEFSVSEMCRLAKPLDCVDDRDAIEWGALEQQLIYENFAATAMRLHFCEYLTDEKAIPQAISNLENLINSPDAQLARKHCVFPHDVDVMKGNTADFSPPCSLQLLMRKSERKRINWPAGGRAAYPSALSFFYDRYLAARDWLTRIRLLVLNNQL